MTNVKNALQRCGFEFKSDSAILRLAGSSITVDLSGLSRNEYELVAVNQTSGKVYTEVVGCVEKIDNAIALLIVKVTLGL